MRGASTASVTLRGTSPNFTAWTSARCSTACMCRTVVEDKSFAQLLGIELLHMLRTQFGQAHLAK